MKGMKSAKEYYVPPPPSRYLSKIVAATPEFSKKSGATMIKITAEIRQPDQYAGQQADDYIITDGAAGGGGTGKQKLRGLGIDVDASDSEIPDAMICERILGREIWVEFGNEQKYAESIPGSKKYDKEMTAVDPTTGEVVKLKKFTVVGYHGHSVGGPTHAQAPTQAPQFTPTQLPVNPQSYAPQMPQYAQPQAPQMVPPAGPPPQQWAPPPQMQAPIQQYAPVPQQPQAPQYAPQAQQVPQMAPQQPQQAPQASAPQFQPGQMPWAQPGQAPQAPQAPQGQPVWAGQAPGGPPAQGNGVTPPWMQVNPQGAPQADAEGPKKRGRKPAGQ